MTDSAVVAQSPQQGKSGATSDIWSSMLKSVGGVNATPSGTLLLLGGSKETQVDLIKQLQDSSVLNPTSQGFTSTTPPKFPEIANSFALGYTFIEFKDYDHDDHLSHLDIYTLLSPSHESYSSILLDFMDKQMRKASTKPLLVSIVVDWTSNVKNWAREIAEWIVMLQISIQKIDPSVLSSMKEKLQHRLQTYCAPSGDTTETKSQYSVVLPLEPGQFDLPLGFDLLFIAANSERVSFQDHETSFSDDAVDYIQQFLRTIALKHGASLIYAPSSSHHNSNNLAKIITERLQIPITSHNNSHGERGEHYSIPMVVDQSHIMVPAGWDSRGKILALREGFTAELIGEQWNNDVQIPELESSTELPPLSKNKSTETSITQETEVYEDVVTEPESKPIDKKVPMSSAVEIFEKAISTLHPADDQEDESRITENNTKQRHGKTYQNKTDFQEFLASQYEILDDQIKKHGEGEGTRGTSPYRRANRQFPGGSESNTIIQGVPQTMDINIGGIQIEGVEEVLRRLKIQEVASSNNPGTPSSIRSDSTPGASPFGAGIDMSMNGISFDSIAQSQKNLQQAAPKYSEENPAVASKRTGSPYQSSHGVSSNIRGSSPTPRAVSVGGGVNHLGGGFNTTPTRLTSPPANRSDEASYNNKSTTPTLSSKSQNEVLANFFQTLLDKRNSSPGSGNTSGH